MIGGIIFIIGTFLSIIALLFMKKIDFSPNLFITLFVFVSYALIGFLDDYLSVKKKNNIGLTTIQKLFKA